MLPLLDGGAGEIIRRGTLGIGDGSLKAICDKSDTVNSEKWERPAWALEFFGSDIGVTGRSLTCALGGALNDTQDGPL